MDARMEKPRNRYFDISTGGAALLSLRQNRDIMEKDVLDKLDLVTFTEEEWNRPPSSATITVLLIGIIARCTQHNEKAKITVHKDNWKDLSASGFGSKEILSCFRQRLSLIPNTICLDFIPSGCQEA